jgi:hypothetical protein
VSGLDKWLHFFEEASPSRSAENWWKPIKAQVLGLGVKVRHIVSDRAKALVKLGEEPYLGVMSMPDLFHFVQDINKAAGLQIGILCSRLQKTLGKSKEEEQTEALSIELEQAKENAGKYRKEIEQINKIVHPFNEADQWQSQQEVEKLLNHSFTRIGKIAGILQVEIAIEKALKILNQIPAIAQGVQVWVDNIQKELDEWVKVKTVPIAHRYWLEKVALPYAYWQLQLKKTQAKKRNVDLRAHYRQRVENAQRRYEDNELNLELDEATKRYYLEKAFYLAASFQRSSSQVEGRNGYLAFVHHAHKGIPKQRLQVLTVVHNFDIRRQNGTTPAQRLFRREFPNLFEFLCQNVTGFAEPRLRSDKTLIINPVQR